MKTVAEILVSSLSEPLSSHEPNYHCSRRSCGGCVQLHRGEIVKHCLQVSIISQLHLTASTRRRGLLLRFGTLKKKRRKFLSKHMYWRTRLFDKFEKHLLLTITFIAKKFYNKVYKMFKNS